MISTRIVAVLASVAMTSWAMAQAPITVQVINDSGLSDGDVYLLLSGSDVGVVPSSGPASAYPFSVSGISKTPIGTVVNTSGGLVTSAGTAAATSAPLTVVSGASGISMAFASTAAPAGLTVPTIAAGGTATLTIGLPNGSSPTPLTQPFSVAMPQGVTIASSASTGTCSGLQVRPGQILVPAGTSLPANGCTIIVPVTSSTPGTVTATTSYLQTTGANTSPPVAPLTVTASASTLTMAFAPATIAIGTPATLTIELPNASGVAQTLSADFVDAMPATIVTQSPNTGTCKGVTVAAARVSLPAGATIPPNGCTIVVTVVSIASGGALSGLAPATGANGPLVVASPYSGQPRPVYQFTMSTVSSGNLFISYDTPVAYPPAPTVRAKYRFQPLEFSYSQFIVSNGDLTSIDFYGIPLTLMTFPPGDAAFRDPLDHVTYYTSTKTLLKSFVNVEPNLAYAFLRTDGTTFDPSTDSMASFARIVGPNQLAAPGTSPISPPAQAPSGWTGAWPPGQGSPWPYPSFADYLDRLVAAQYRFVESDSGVISAYTFNYTGTISGDRTSGYTITLSGTTNAPSPLPSNATITLNLPPQSNANGGLDFVIYGVPQNCGTLVISGFPCVPATPANGATPANPGNVERLTNSVYGWIQADVISALNFGYMNGKADRANGSKPVTGQSSAWYGLPPVPYPFGAARSTNDGFYNIWAALMYNHSDAYGFAFSDRKGRPSPDISFPVGGTLRIWILPDTRLDGPIATVSQASASSIQVSWPTVANADHYVVTWSPRSSIGSSATVAQPGPGVDPVGYAIQSLTAGTPYTISVRAYSADGSQASYAAQLYTRTTGTTPKASAGNAVANFGFNWTPPGGGAAPELHIAGFPPFEYGGNGAYTISTPFPITVGLPPSSAPLTVTGAPCAATSVCVTLSISPTIGGSATLTLVLSNPGASTSLTLKKGYLLPLPSGVTATPVGTQCTGVTVNSNNIAIGAVEVNKTSPSCTITAMLTATTAGVYLVVAPDVTTDQGIGQGATGALVISGGAGEVAQTIAPPAFASGGTAHLTLTLANATGNPLTLTAPFVDVMPAGVTNVSSSNLGTCSGVAVTATQVTLPAGSTIPPGGCTIEVMITSSTAGTVVNTTGGLFTNATVYPTQWLPMELRVGGDTIWSANYYLTFIGSPQQFSLGPCAPTDACVGSGAASTVPFDTLRAPNFLERQGAPLSVTGGASGTGPPFGGATPTIGVSFTPEANKQPTPVAYPAAGSMSESPSASGKCRKTSAPSARCP